MKSNQRSEFSDSENKPNLINAKNQKNQQRVISKNSFIKANKENAGPANGQNMGGNYKSVSKLNTKSSSLLVIPRMHSINSKLPKQPQKSFKPVNNASYVVIAKDAPTLTNVNKQKSYKLLSDYESEKAKTQLLSSQLCGKTSGFGQSSIGSEVEADQMPEVEIEFCNSQYNSVLKLANRLKKEETKQPDTEKPGYQKSTFSIERKKRKK